MLTESQIRACKPKEKDYMLSDNTRRRESWRLVLVVRPHGTKEWRLRTIIDGKRKFRSIGTYPELPLEKARSEALRLSTGATESPALPNVQGTEIVPLEAPPEAYPTHLYGTLGELAQAYTDDMRERGRRTADETYQRLQRYIQRPFPHLWNKQARDVTVHDIRDLLAHYIQKGITTTTNRLRAWLHAAYSYGLTCENDPRRTVQTKWGLEANPVTHVPKQADFERQGDTVMSIEDIRKAWEYLPQMRARDANAVPAILLCLATAGQRITSLLRLSKQDVHLNRMLLDVPASGTKNKRPHIVPLTEQAVAILEPLLARCEARGHDLLFPNHRDYTRHMLLESPSSLVADYRKEFKANQWTVRDIRRTAKTVLGELGVTKHTRDLLHGHALQDVSSKHYDRYDYLKEKREAMQVWEAWLSAALDGKDIRVPSK